LPHFLVHSFIHIRLIHDEIIMKWWKLLIYGMKWMLFIFTARRSYASAVLRVVILSVGLSVKRVLCDKTKQYTADILIQHQGAITLCYHCQLYILLLVKCTFVFFFSFVSISYLSWWNKDFDFSIFWHQQWLVGDAPFVWNLCPTALRKTPTSTDFRL